MADNKKETKSVRLSMTKETYQELQELMTLMSEQNGIDLNMKQTIQLAIKRELKSLRYQSGKSIY